MSVQLLNREQEASESSSRATHIGSLAYQTLLRHQDSYLGQSLVVFPNSIYLRSLDGELLNLTKKTVKSPININLTGNDSLHRGVVPGRTAHVSNGACFVDRICVELEDAEVYYPKVRISRQITGDFEELSRNLLSAAFQTGIMYSCEAVLDQNSLTYRSFARFAQEAIRELEWFEDKAFVEGASEVLGRGEGFTPAGDDLIAGFLGVFNTFAAALKRGPVILSPAILARTTWISGKLLDYMQRGLFDEEFGAVVDALISPNGEALVGSLQNLASRGHTSGLDLCGGAIIGAATVFDLAFSKELTEKVAARLGYTDL